MESNWRLFGVEQGIIPFTDPIFPSDGREFLIAQRLDLPNFYVTNLWGNGSNVALAYLTLTGTWPWFEPYFFLKPNVHGNFPYGFHVNPDHL